MAKKRERLEVIYDMLKAIRDNNNAIKPTRLLHISNVSPQMYKEYLDELLLKGFILENANDSRKVFSLTEKGFEFLEKYKVIVEFIDNFGL
jgi:predicted transcriptional regulator